MSLTNKQKIGLGIGVVVAIAVIVGVLMFTYNIRGQGRIMSVEVKVYKDLGLTEECLLIDWGDLRPGGESSATVYIKNVGNLNLTLGLEAVNWDPPGASILVLSWDYDGRILEPGASLEAVLTLNVPSTISGVTDFFFDIVIKSSSVEP